LFTLFFVWILVETMNQNLNFQELRQELDILKQQTVCKANRAAGSWLNIHFGEETISHTGHETGEWVLYIYEPWLFYTQEQGIVSSNDKQHLIDETLLSIKGLTLEDILVSEPSFDLLISFSNGLRLKVFIARTEAKYGASTMPYWMFSHNKDFIISTNPRRGILYDKLGESH
jgi:hypothetical protein